MRLRLLVPLVVWSVLISIASSFSNPPGRPAAEWPSYVAHFLEFLVFGLLAARYVSGVSRSRPGWLLFAVALALSALFAVADEIHQAFVPHRDASALDWLVDVSGSAAGAGIWLKRRFADGARRSV